MITYTPPKKAKGLKTIENILCENGYLVVFSNIDDCTQHIETMYQRERFQRYIQIGSISFLDVLEIAHQYDMDVLIDINRKINSKCFMYAHKEKELKVVMLAQY
ncbi:MAG: hypothetical protein K2M91_02675 [Lachnospiraceae bacterium]|nr:hypothetical protein [Lachnospiraceae bacterium]